MVPYDFEQPSFLPCPLTSAAPALPVHKSDLFFLNQYDGQGEIRLLQELGKGDKLRKDVLESPPFWGLTPAETVPLLIHPNDPLFLRNGEHQSDRMRLDERSDLAAHRREIRSLNFDQDAILNHVHNEAVHRHFESGAVIGVPRFKGGVQ